MNKKEKIKVIKKEAVKAAETPPDAAAETPEPVAAAELASTVNNWIAEFRHERRLETETVRENFRRQSESLDRQ